MKYYLTILLIIAAAFSSSAQNQIQSSDDESMNYTFSENGCHNCKTEITLRYTAGFVTEGPALTAGVRVDDKRTFGIWIGQGDTYLDAAPGNIMAIQTAVYMRRYVHLGRRDIAALYGEFALGCGWIYQVNGKYLIYDNPDTGEHWQEEHIEDSKGDVNLYAAINAGVRFRIVKNVQLFLGPTLTTNTLGVHLGVGF